MFPPDALKTETRQICPAGKEARRSCIRSDTASRNRRGQPGCRVDRRPV